MVDSQCGRHTPLRTPFRYIYLGVIRAKDDDLFAAGAVFCVRFHAPTVNYFRFRPGVEFAVRAVITFESAYFFFIHSRISPLILPKEAVAAKRRHGYRQIILRTFNPLRTRGQRLSARGEDREYKRAGLDVIMGGGCLEVDLLRFRLVDLHHRGRMVHLAAGAEDGGPAHHQCGHQFAGNVKLQLPLFQSVLASL